MSALGAEQERLLMMQACVARGRNGPATFEVRVCRLPPGTGHLVAAGLEQVIQYLKSFSFSEAEQAWLATQSTFSADFLAYTGMLRFDGDVHGMPEGSIFFADQPILRVHAPLALAQYLETRLLNLLRHQVAVASWASCLVRAAQGRSLIDWSLESADSAESALLAARACYLGGFEATSSPDACRRFRIPLVRSVTLARPEVGPLRPEVLGPSVYGPALAVEGVDFIRLVGSDLATQAVAVRARLDAQGLHAIKILACGDFDADRIAALARSGAPIDAFGPRGAARPAEDALAPWMVYAMAGSCGEPAGSSAGAAAEGRQVWRRFAADGTIAGDTVAPEAEPGPPGAAALLQQVVRGGRRIDRATTLEASRAHHAAQILTLPPSLREPRCGDRAPEG